jgi:hypothetical protein
MNAAKVTHVIEAASTQKQDRLLEPQIGQSVPAKHFKV